MALAVQRLNDTPPLAPRVVLAHGFTQNSHCWGSFGDQIAQGADVVAVDMPGHGNSHHDDADLEQAGDLLVAAGGPGVYLGYSMGGRVALHVALRHADAVQALVLIGATAGITDDSERRARRDADAALAQSLLDDGVEPFIDRWLKTPLFAHLSADQQCRDARLTNRAAGLAASLRHCGTGEQEPLHPVLRQLSMPVLVLAGAEDAKFIALGAELAGAIGDNAATAIIDGTGHACHLEQPAATASTIRRWLDEVLKRPQP